MWLCWRMNMRLEVQGFRREETSQQKLLPQSSCFPEQKGSGRAGGYHIIA